jgi:hypothetical protein
MFCSSFGGRLCREAQCLRKKNAEDCFALALFYLVFALDARDLGFGKVRAVRNVGNSIPRAA